MTTGYYVHLQDHPDGQGGYQVAIYGLATPKPPQRHLDYGIAKDVAKVMADHHGFWLHNDVEGTVT